MTELAMNDQARTDLIALLRGHRAADQKEARDLRRMKRFARTLAQPFSRQERKAHFTASAILMDATQRCTCLVYHRKLGRWLQPGGHFEPEDEGQVDVAALREVAEETGCRAIRVAQAPPLLDVDIHPIPARGTEPAHLHLDLRILVLAPVRVTTDELGGSQALQWLGWSEAVDRADDASLRRALHKATRFVTATE
jgi:8-oxo-dGTP pyrophosphatase MutT (NUDIX family)